MACYIMIASCYHGPLEKTEDDNESVKKENSRLNEDIMIRLITLIDKLVSAYHAGK